VRRATDRDDHPGVRPWRPTPAQLAAAYGSTIRDVVAAGLDVVFVGINPGLYSGAVGHHFARPGNRFWKALHLSGFTRRQLSPFEERVLLDEGLGVTNIVRRSTAAAAELSPEELRAGARRVRALAERYQPRWLAFLGLGAYRTAFESPGAIVGLQPDDIGPSRVWLLPNPSGLNASFQIGRLVDAFRDLREAVLSSRPPRRPTRTRG
jgi:TDG/mug DNA glycosylase family protein